MLTLLTTAVAWLLHHYCDTGDTAVQAVWSQYIP